MGSNMPQNALFDFVITIFQVFVDGLTEFHQTLATNGLRGKAMFSNKESCLKVQFQIMLYFSHIRCIKRDVVVGERTDV